MRHMEESLLIRACCDNDRNAQRELYELHVERIYRLVLRLLRSEQDAFDVTQDTFIRVFDKIGSFDQRSSLSTWLYRIATNEALQLLRRRAIEQKHLGVIRDQLNETTPARNERLELEEAMGLLSDSHRAILVLRYQQGLSYEQLALVLGLNPGTVASRLNRARTELRRALEGNREAPLEETRPATHPTDGRRCSDDL